MADDPKKIVLEQIEALREVFIGLGDVAGSGIETLDAMREVVEAWNGQPPELPVLDIHDAAPVRAGEVLEFRVTLDRPHEAVTVLWTAQAVGQVESRLVIPSGDMAGTILVSSAPVGSVTVTLSAPEGASIGRGAATGTVLADGPDLARGRLYHSETPITAPIDLGAGRLLGAKAVAMVVKVTTTTGRHRKFIGAASSGNSGQGAFGIGLNPRGSLDVWRPGGGQFNAISGPPPFQARKATMLFWAVDEAGLRQAVEIDDADKHASVTLPLVPIDGAAAVGAGYWGGARVDHLAPDGEIRTISIWNRVPSTEEWTLWEEQHKHLVDAEPDEPDNGEPPPPPPPPPDDEDPRPPETVRTIEVTPESAAGAFAAMQTKTRFQLTPGTYHLPPIIPKDDCMFVAVGGKATLDGQAADKRAFAGPASRVWLQGLVIKNYRGPGMPAEFKKLGGRPAGSQVGAIHPDVGRGKGPAKDWVILDSDVSENYCRGITLGTGFVVKRTKTRDNGGNGMTGRAAQITIDGCVVTGNQRFQVETTWDGAGIKLLGGAFADKAPAARDLVVRRTIIAANGGFGLWFDWNVFLAEVDHCSIYGNTFPGIQMEASALIHAHHNQVGDNLRGGPFGIFTFEIGYQNSKRCTVEHNLILCARHGVARIGQQNRTGAGGGSPQGDAHVGHFTATENTFSDNVMIMQTAGGFGFQHDRHGCSSNDYGNTGMACPQQEGQGFGVNPPLPGNVRDIGMIPNAFGWLPQQGQDLRNRAERNTYRGTPGPRWSFEKDAKLLGSMAAPDWSKVPTWDEPPGRD